MKKYLSMFLAAALALGVAAGAARAQDEQEAPARPDLTIDAAMRTAVLEKLVKELNDRYVFPATAAQIEAVLRARLSAGEYDAVTSARAFAALINADLRAVSRDRHLNFFFSARPLPPPGPDGKPSADERRAEEERLRLENFGFYKTEILPGNVGYLDLREFTFPRYGAETLAAAMNFVAGADALIIDLRRNRGGEPEMVALVCSYLFDAPVHLNDVYNRETGRTQQFWTEKSVAGRKFLGKNVYLLTSARTFSAAEEFVNDLKVLKRATIVGETTLGGANPGVMVRLAEHFEVYVPNERAINPVTKTNWEGAGVEPDVKTPKELALETAYGIALGAALERTGDERAKSEIRELIERNRKRLAAASGAAAQ